MKFFMQLIYIPFWFNTFAFIWLICTI